MSDRAARPFRRYVNAAKTLLFGLAGLFAIVLIVWGVLATIENKHIARSMIFEPPFAVFLGLLAGMFWLPACRLLKGTARESLANFLLAGAMAGWFFGFLFDGPIACAWGSLGAWLEAQYLTVAYVDHGEHQAVEACTRAFPLYSAMTIRGALGACFWVLFYWKVFVHPGSARRRTSGTEQIHDRQGAGDQDTEVRL